MQIRQLGWTDLKLTTLGLGTWALSGLDWGPQEDRDSIATVSRALERGMNWIDTAAVYGRGHAEALVGRAIREAWARPFLATKCGRVVNDKGELVHCLKKESIRAEAEGSLRRLGVETIDLYQMHWPIPAEDIEEGWGAMADLVRAGKVRYLGASNFTVEELERAGAIHPIASLQPPYSLIRRRAETALFDYCRTHRIGVVAYSPLGRGMLTGKFTRERALALPESDSRGEGSAFREPELGANLALVEALRPIAGRAGRSLAELALAWVLRRGEVASAIVGCRRPGQVDETAPAGDWKLSAEEIAAVQEALTEREKRLRQP
ncbi:MAG: aldo/keto reductase [Planctomycetota bacterium]